MCFLYTVCIQMPHESTVMTEPDGVQLDDDEDLLVQYRTRSRTLHGDIHAHQPAAGTSSAGHGRMSLVAETPLKITHHHDDDDDDAQSLAADSVTT